MSGPRDGDGSLARPPCAPGGFSSLKALCRASCLQPTGLSPEAARKRYLPRGPLSPRPTGVIVQGLSFYRFPRRPGQAGNSLEFPTIVQREAGSGQTGSRSAQAGSSPPARRPRCQLVRKGLGCALGAEAPGRPPGESFLTGAREKVQLPSFGERKHCSGHGPPDVMRTIAMGPTPPAGALSGPLGATTVPSGSPLGPFPVGLVALVVVDFYFLTLGKSLLRRGPYLAIPLARPVAEAETPGDASPAALSGNRRLLVSPHKEGPPSKESLRPGQRMRRAAWPPGARGSMDTGPWRPTAQAQLPALPPRGPPHQIKYLGPTYTKTSSQAPGILWAHLAMTPAGRGPNVARPKYRAEPSRCPPSNADKASPGSHCVPLGHRSRGWPRPRPQAPPSPA